jgi:uncharacterized protein YbjT (DUF2867 family)
MTILVTGATGSVGRRLIDRLIAASEQVRAASRNPAAARLPAGVEVTHGDLGKLETLPELFDGVDRMLLICINDDRVLDHPVELLDLAGKAGVRRVVVLSASGRPYRWVEQPVEQSGLEWTHVRPGEFATTKIDMWAPSIRAEGVARSAYLNIPTVPIHESDIADVAAMALTEDGHAGHSYELTGPVQITQREQIDAIAAAIGKPIQIIELTPAEARANMIREGWPAVIADHDLGYFLEWEIDPPEPTTTVLDLTGRPGRTFAEWAADHVADFT